MSFIEKLSNVVNRYEEINALLSSPNVNPDDLVKMNKELSNLTPIVEAIQNYKRMEKNMKDAEAMMGDASLDKDMKELAEAEYYELKDQLPELEKAIKILLLPKDEEDEKNAILEVRAGTGGDEAALFATVLFEMYKRYAGLQGWKFEEMDVSENGLGGYKEASASITGKDVFSKLKFESGAHRVQRVPVTESQGRVHTSAATVAVLPEVEEVDLYINPTDLKIDVYRASGAGGQHVNKTESAVRITHLPTNTVVQCQDGRSQFKNKEQAMRQLRAKLYDVQRETKDAEYSERRKLQVGSGDRSERIRTYNYPQGRVTDHRINLTLYKLDEVVSGDALGEIIDALVSEDQAQRLAELD
ncbi:MAG: peptide chain release factor 1 [Lactobacillaceae bacterium]|jgi:peptide chain release factor 1|nr:peptide chain release factor 1 [Lactobacillaceae bacterium]